MFGFRDPEQAAAVIVGIVVIVAIVVVGAIANRHTIGALLNFAFARPIYLGWTVIRRGREEWAHHKHSLEYVFFQRELQRRRDAVEDWLRAEEPELVTS